MNIFHFLFFFLSCLSPSSHPIYIYIYPVYIIQLATSVWATVPSPYSTQRGATIPTAATSSAAAASTIPIAAAAASIHVACSWMCRVNIHYAHRCDGTRRSRSEEAVRATVATASAMNSWRGVGTQGQQQLLQGELLSISQYCWWVCCRAPSNLPRSVTL